MLGLFSETTPSEPPLPLPTRAVEGRAARRTCLVTSSWCSTDSVVNTSYFVPTKNATAGRLSPRACRYHSLTEVRVDFRERSNIKKIADASLHTKGNIERNSRWNRRLRGEWVFDSGVDGRGWAWWVGERDRWRR